MAAYAVDGQVGDAVGTGVGFNMELVQALAARVGASEGTASGEVVGCGVGTGVGAGVGCEVRQGMAGGTAHEKPRSAAAASHRLQHCGTTPHASSTSNRSATAGAAWARMLSRLAAL